MQSWMISLAIGLVTAGAAVITTLNANKASGAANEIIVARLDRSSEELWTISNRQSTTISVIEQKITELTKEVESISENLSSTANQGMRTEQNLRALPTNKYLAEMYVSKEILLEKQRHLYTQIEPMKLQIDKLIERQNQ
ncbi:MAG: hypothetical protein H0A75_00095 [Candidatus Methanofishera endochildressiae]|uniref:Uncharacterized protein n=1 Tax=Candidatus Methanofishera endochildressiae TaxID=2738884 RepID=A0A7Z0SCY8_9GAMM|nr:hypothetical protein [Candidatus Methanofishera endochildressiae]